MNTVLIKEVNNTPYIFNVDNSVDAARLEELQAVKMAEDLVSSVFGEQSNFADNTTCTISANQDNPAFPYDIVFDASKITAAPKRNISTLSALAIPSANYIDIPKKSGIVFQAPANGFVVAEGNYHAPSEGPNTCYLRNYGSDADDQQTIYSAISNSPYGLGVGGTVAVKKGDYVGLVNPIAIQILRFVYAEGEI